MMGFLDRIRQDEEEGATNGEAGGEDELLFEDEGGDDDLGDLDGLGDFGDDAFGEMDGGEGESSGELSNRVDELENEISTLSSTVNTVRSENEEIAETVGDIEENIRKLLDIYEMVTRGVNPFVDDVSPGGDFSTGSLGLFDEDDGGGGGGGGGDDGDELDSSVADAAAEDFFDEDLVDEEPAADAFTGGSVSNSGGTDDSAAPIGSEQSPTPDPADGGGSSDDSGKSFAELKGEYENEDADWADDDAPGDLGGLEEADGGAAETTSESAWDDAADLGGEDPGAEGDSGADDGTASGAEWGADAGAQTDTDPTPSPEADRETETRTAEPPRPEETSDRTPQGDMRFAEDTLSGTSGMTEKPYLVSMPGGYVSDLVVMEWLEFLVEEGDTADAARALYYYEAIEWIDESVTESLQTFLRGFGDAGDVEADESPSELTMAHHARSLQYISRLASATSETVVLNQWLSDGGGVGGIQR